MKVKLCSSGQLSRRKCPFHVVSAGVGVRHELGDNGYPRAIGVVIGGHRTSLELEPVLAAARAALDAWPEPIATLEVVVEDPRERSAVA